jgi:HK97 family phage major capsid protein
MTPRHRQLAAQHADLVRRRKELAGDARAMGDQAESQKRLLGPDEKTRIESMLAEIEDLNPKIEAVEAEIGYEERLAASERTSIIDLSKSGAKLNDQEFSGIGEFMQAVAVASDPIWRSRIGASKADTLMNKLGLYQNQGIQAAASGMSVGVPADGGFLVRKDWSTAMLDRAREQAVLFPRTRNIPIGADADSLEYPYVDETSRATGSRWGGVRVYWMAEAETKQASKPKIGRGELRLEEIAGLAYATERLMRDASALESLLGDAFESEFAFVIDDAIIRGDGVGKPLGFFAPGPSLVSVAKESAQAADTVVAGNILKMFARMPARLKAGAVWLIHPDVMTQLPTMAIGQQPMWMPPGNMTAAPNGLLLGKPVIEIEQAEALGDQGDIFFVNLNEYAVITKAGEGLRYDTSMHVRFINNEMAFRWVFRINGQPTWRASLAPYKGAQNSSPFITLDARA